MTVKITDTTTRDGHRVILSADHGLARTNARPRRNLGAESGDARLLSHPRPHFPFPSAPMTVEITDTNPLKKRGNIPS